MDKRANKQTIKTFSVELKNLKYNKLPEWS